MRDSNRIEKYTEELKRVWKKVPDWRFGQLICNFLKYENKDVFYMEDEEFFKELNRFEKEFLMMD